MTIDCRADFPLLARRDAPIYLDSAASSLKPRRVIDAVAHCLAEYPANVHRSGHRLGERASSEVEATRLEVARFINARPEEIIFTSGATESINLVVNSLITSGDEEVALLGDGHNSSWLPVRERGRVFQSFNLEEDLRRKPSLLIVTACSNVTGTLVDVQSAVELAHHAGVPVLVDGAQSVPHMTTDVSDLGCDFLAFSGHKMLAPSGVGVLYCAPAWHERLVPLQHGGGTISAFAGDDAVSRLSLPRGFEAGTPNVPGIVGLGEAIRYLRGIGMGRIAAHSIRLHAKLQAALTMVSQVDPGGDATGMVSFYSQSASAEFIATTLDQGYGIMARSGFHCAHPMFRHRGLPEVVRASTYLYNNESEIELLVEALGEIVRLL